MTGPDRAAERWVADRRPPAPDAVRRSVAAALAEETAGGAVSGRLAAAGLDALCRVVDGPGDRSSALALLTADALLTYAVEAAAGEGRAALDALLASLGPGRFEAILAREDADR